VVSFAVDEANLKSQFIAATSPMPAQAPLIAATIGLGIDRGNVNGVRRCGSVVASLRAFSASTSASIPGQKLRPAPVTTMTLTLESRAHSSSRRKYSVSIGTVHPLLRSGRFQVSTATPSATVRVTSPLPVTVLANM
jgi:hypothetical protein